MLRLRFLLQGEDRSLPLLGARVRLGREVDNDVVLPDPSVSRHHAELLREDGGWSVQDLRSTNGVLVNGVAVRRAPLQPGDRLSIGAFELRLEARDEAPSPAGGRERSGAAAALSRTAPAAGGNGGAPAPRGGASALDAPPARPAPVSSAPAEPRIPNATILRPLAQFQAEYGLEEEAESAGTSRIQERPEGDPGYAHRMLGWLTRLARVLITSDSVDAVLARVMAIAFEALPVDRGFILLSDEAGELVCELARFGERVELRPAAEVPVSQTMLRSVMRERVALVTYDALSDDRLAGGQSILIHQIRAAMCAPLWSGERIIGVVQLDSPFQVGTFGERDLDFLTTIANYAAVAVERIRYAAKADLERRVRSRLERYHSPAVVEEVLSQTEVDEGVRRLRPAQATVVFADLVGFTAFAENLAPEEVARLLDAFLGLSVEAVFAAGGTLDKFIGDCVMAFFGAPVEQPDHALRAVRAAIEIQRGLAAWNAGREARGLPELAARVGINSGPVVVGDIGSSRRVDYTVLGNTVNVAARLETAVARSGDVVIGPETHRLLAGAVPTEPLGELQLKGLQQKIQAYRVVGG